LFKEPSLRRQLVFWLVLPLSTALICSGLIAYRLALDFVSKAYDRALYDSALDLSRRLLPRSGGLVIDLPPAAVDMLENDELDRVYYTVSSDRGDLVIGQRDLPQPPFAPDRRPRYYDGVYGDQPVRLVALRFPYDPDDPQAMALIVVAETLQRRDLLRDDILVGVAGSQLVLIIMVSLATYLGVGHGLLPLGRLRRQIETRSHRDLTPLDEPHTPVEVRPLVQAINELMMRLQRAIAAQQKFIADAAHQLRTPLAGLKTHAELALREQDLNGMRERVRALTLATDRSAHLAHQLLALARAEPEAGATAPMAPVDVNALAREVTREWVPKAIDRGLDLGAACGDSPLLVRGNAVLVREMLGNLIDNALRYTPAGGRVTVKADSRERSAVLSVEDDGPGIAEADRVRVFERFQRLNEVDTQGCGLGLSIVREIADLHAATVEIVSGANDRGTLVSVTFAAVSNESPSRSAA